MPDLPELIRTFTRARYAAWAGDLQYSRRLLKRILPQSNGHTETKRSWDSTGMVLNAANELLAHINGESDSKQDALPDMKVFPADEILIGTLHLRGVIHRTGNYEFEVRAYLNDLDWEASLYKRCSDLSEKYDRSSLRERVRTIRRKELESDNAEVRRPSASWRIVDEDLLRTVSLGAFGLIKIKAIWIRRDPPEDFERIRKKLETALWEIDHSEKLADEVVESER